MKPSKKSSSSRKKYPPNSFMGRLRKRRILETIAGFAGGGIVVIEFAHHILVNHYHFPHQTVDICLATLIAALLSTLVWRWFGGIKTPRKIKTEFILIPLIILIAAFFDIRLILQVGEPEAVIMRKSGLDPNRIVVAIFENQTGDNTYDFIGHMAADWITKGLAQTGFLTVVPVSPEEIIAGVLQRENRIQELAKKTGASTVVSGSYYLQGDIVHFQANISNVPEGLLSAIEPVNGPVGNPLKPIQLLRQRLMGALATIIDPRLNVFIEIQSQPPTYESYQEYIEGFTFFVRRKYRQAIEHFKQATALDPTFVLPLLWASIAHRNLNEYAKVEAILKEVEKVRGNLAPVNRHFLDLLYAWCKGNTAAAFRESRDIARLAPGEVWNYQLGLDAINYNHPQEAIDALVLLNPEGIWMKGWYNYWWVLTEAHHMLGNHKQELRMARLGRKQYPEFLSTLWYETRALAALGRIKEVNKLIDESFALPPQPEWDPGVIMLLAGRELRAHGYREASFQVLERAIEWFESRSQEELVSSTSASL